jgi:acetyltransferase
MKELEPGVPPDFEKKVKLRDGTRVLIRPIKPEDKDLWVDFYLGLSKLSKYYRFFSSRPKPSNKMIKEYTEIDYVNNFALVAIIKEEGEKKMIGVARYVLIPKSEQKKAEVAVVIADKWQAKGLGTKMLMNLLDILIKRKIKKICGDIFLENDKMMQLVGQSGFQLTSENEAGVKHFEIPLQ